MKFPFKKVGDTFSVDEYNAMCYLLCKQDYEEDIILEQKAKHYQYGVYKLSDSKFGLIAKDGGFLIRNPHTTIVITFAHQNPSADFYVELKVAKQKIIHDKGEDIIDYPYDIKDILDDTIPDENYNIDYETIKLKAVQEDKYTSKVYFVPVDHGLLADDFLSNESHMIMDYKAPHINFEDGREVDCEQIICDDYWDIQRAIISAPESSVVNLRLRGGKTYTFEDKIFIDFNKKVYIEGGNVSSNSHSILDGQDLYKMFHVKPDAFLSVRNCKFVNGNATVVHGNSDVNKTGGAISMNSGYYNMGDVNGLHYAFVELGNCIFENCKAERGGAIYNHMGKLDIDKCQFINCKATNPDNVQGAYGGAVACTSVSLYNGASNQIAIDRSKYFYNNNNTSYILLSIKETQNINYFTNIDFTLNDMILHKDNNTFNLSATKDNDNQYKYNIQIPTKLNVDDQFYITFKNFEAQPSLSTRLLKVTGNKNTQMYVEMV